MKPERLWMLMAKKKSGEATREELEELRLLLADNPGSGYSNEIIEKVWQAPLTTIPENRISENTWQKINEQTGTSRGSRLLRMFDLTKSLTAASIIIALSLVGIVAYNHFSEGSDLAAARKNMNHVTTQPGSKSKLELPDGTQVWLNGDSKLTYTNGSFGKENREVMLTGEAFFDVVKNEKIPFIIHTGPVNITVKGTAFNVKAYPKEKTVETSLVRGLVEITTTDDPERKILLKPNEKIIIPVDRSKTDNAVPHDRDSSEASLYTITKLESSNREPAEIAWINTQLVFDDEPFATLAPKMESWYNIRIYFADENLKNKRFSGVIEHETLNETLEAMQLSFHFDYHLKGKELWVGKK
jgi:ferric-dicitrate binding protein FerR (iron transport regulator)